MTVAHFFVREYDDLYKFEWPVLLDYDTLSLWLDVSRLKDHGFNLPNDLPTKSAADFTFKNGDGPDENLRFCRAADLRSVANHDDDFNTVLEQFVFHQLPRYLGDCVDELKLVSLFSIKDFWERLAEADLKRKYWLLRLKIVTISFENKRRNDNLEIVNETEFVSENSEATENSNKFGIDTELVFTLCCSIVDNVNVLFKHLNVYDDVDKIHASLNFNKVLMGSVGLLEILLGWC